MNESFIRLLSFVIQNPLFDLSLWIRDLIFDNLNYVSLFLSSGVFFFFVFINSGDEFKASQLKISCVRNIGIHDCMKCVNIVSISRVSFK